MRFFVLFSTLLYFLSTPNEAIAHGDYHWESVGTHGGWQTFVSDTEDAWGTSIPQGDEGDVRFICSADQQVEIQAYTDGFISQSLGSIWQARKPIEVEVEVDTNNIIHTQGEYPNTLSTDRTDIHKIIKEMQSGMEVRIRTKHGSEQHTFIAGLLGFATASNWVLSQCGVSI